MISSLTRNLTILRWIGVLGIRTLMRRPGDPYRDFLINIKRLLKPDGKLLIAMRESVWFKKYWCGTPEDHVGIPFEALINIEMWIKE